MGEWMVFLYFKCVGDSEVMRMGGWMVFLYFKSVDDSGVLLMGGWMVFVLHGDNYNCKECLAPNSAGTIYYNYSICLHRHI